MRHIGKEADVLSAWGEFRPCIVSARYLKNGPVVRSPWNSVDLFILSWSNQSDSSVEQLTTQWYTPVPSILTTPVKRSASLYSLSSNTISNPVISSLQTRSRLIGSNLWVCILHFWPLVSIDKNTHEITPSEKLTFAPQKLDELQDELPDNAPRFVLLSYEVLRHPSKLSIASSQRREEE